MVMEYTGSRRRPSFFWQALLILLPVALLAAFGFLSLRRDKMLAEIEATQRAQAVAEELLTKVKATIFRSLDSKMVDPLDASFQVDSQGALVYPPPVLPSPVPQPFDLAELNQQQAQSWLSFQQVDAAGDSNSLYSAVQAALHFLDTKPPTNFAASAW